MKDLLKRYHLTQAAFSRLLGIPVRTVEDWCAGVRTPPEYLVKLIVFFLDHRPEEKE